MVGKNDGTGFGEALQDAVERLTVHAEFTGDGIGAGSKHSFAVGDIKEVGEHLPVAKENSLGWFSCSHRMVDLPTKVRHTMKCDMSF